MKRAWYVTLIGYAATLIVLVAVFAPVAWLVISSISTRAELLSVPPHWLPRAPSLQNYFDIFTSSEHASQAAQMFKLALGNSLVVAATVTLLGLAVGSCAAYAFARMEFPGRRLGLLGVMMTRMLPAVSIMIPLYIIVSSLDLLNSKATLIALYLSFTLPFTIWLMVSYFQGIPKELEEAALLDGCSWLGTLIRVILPVSGPGLVATGIFTFMMAWDEFFFALIFTSGYEAKTLPVAIAEFTGRHAIDYTAMTAGGVLAAIPPVLLALIFQRYIVRGLTAGSVKG